MKCHRTSDRGHWERFWERGQRAEEFYSNADRIICQIQRATDVHGKRILEVGAGTGRDSFRLIDAGARVFLLDYAEQSLRIIREVARREGKGVMLIKGDALALPFKNGSFDLVFHQGLLEHFREPEKLLGENFQVLREGGICVVDVPQKYHIYTIIKHILIWLNLWFAGWETEFSLRRLKHVMHRAGFDNEKCYGDWMRPSLFYRLTRELFKYLHVRLPMYPGGPRILRRLRRKMREALYRTPWTLNTCLDVGVVATKPFLKT